MSTDPELHVAYVIGTYPLLTTTFIDREVRMLRARGARVDLVSLRRPPPKLSPEQADLAATTTYLRPIRPMSLVRRHLRFLLRSPRRYLGALFHLLLGPGQSLRDRARTVGHFGIAVDAAGAIEDQGTPALIHAHFIDRAAVVANVASRLLNVPYSITAHASDIYVEPVLLDTKIRDAEFVTTCTGYNHSHLLDTVAGADDKVELLYHGLELGDYTAGPYEPTTPPTILAVGQLKEKKGYTHLLEACRMLVADGVDHRCEIIGEGPQRAELEALIDRLGLGDRVHLRGALAHEEVIAAYRRASLFALPCVVAGNGDRDGIPNVILEAMAMQLPVVSTTTSGIPEAVRDGCTGLLVPAGDSAALAGALEKVLTDTGAAQRMGAEGRRVVVDEFDAQTNVDALYRHFLDAEAG